MMELPNYGHQNPQESILVAVHLSKFVDVVSGANRYLSGHELDKIDQDSLNWAAELLTRAGRGNARGVPSASQLSSNAALSQRAIRKAATRVDEGALERLSSLGDSVRQAKRGDRSAEVETRLKEVVRIFSAVPKMNLEKSVNEQADHESRRRWPSKLNSMS